MSIPSSLLTQQHFDQVRSFYDGAPTTLTRAARGYRVLLAHYFNLLIPPGASVLEIGCGSGGLLALLHAGKKTGLDLSATQIAAARQRVPEAEYFVQAGEELTLPGTYDIILVSDTLNLAADVQLLLARLHPVSHTGTRIILNFHSALWRPVLTLARWLGLKSAQPHSSWLATAGHVKKCGYRRTSTG